MKRYIWITIVAISMILTLTACGKKDPCKNGHEWLENTPNYQQPKTCSICDATEGDPLEAEFAKKGLVVDTDWDKEYTITTPCYNDESKTTTGKYKFANFKRVTSDETLGLEAAEGYEWFIFDLICEYDDANALKYGYTGVYNAGMDYYDTYNIGDSDLGTMFEPGETDLESVNRFRVNWNGVDYPECILLWGEYTEGWNKEGTTCISQHAIYVRIPIDYDGIVISMIPNGSGVIDKIDAGEKVIDCLDEQCVNFRVIPE